MALLKVEERFWEPLKNQCRRTRGWKVGSFQTSHFVVLNSAAKAPDVKPTGFRTRRQRCLLHGAGCVYSGRAYCDRVVLMESSRGPGSLSREYKLVMLGEGGVGKSAIIMQFISHRFPEDHDPTIEDAYKTQIRIDDEPANLDILDTAGQAEFTAMRDQYMRAGEGFIISYSITDRRSFQEARHFKQLIYRVRRTVDTPVVLVGNKSDLAHLRQVSVEEGKELAREFQCPFFETSAAFRYYIDEVFAALVRQIRQKEAEVVRGNERKSRRSQSFWSRLKAPFHRKQQSEH
ncbi:hypothetical protein MHYP_G00345250 [Metynnis hypsauchen]